MNEKQHAVIGAVVTGAVDLLIQLVENEEGRREKINLWRTAGALFASASGWIEPATSPNRRKLFHSLFAGGLVTWAVTGKHTQSWPRELQILARHVAITYGAHLVVDSTTRRSIALFHPAIV